MAAPSLRLWPVFLLGWASASLSPGALQPSAQPCEQCTDEPTSYMVSQGITCQQEVTSAQLDISRWADAMAPAPASAAISRLVAQVFGDGRELARRPLKPGQLKGKRWLAMPKPWSAASWAEAAKIAYVMAPMTTDIAQWKQ